MAWLFPTLCPSPCCLCRLVQPHFLPIEKPPFLNEILLMPYPEQLHQIHRVNVIHKLFSNEILYLILALLCRDVQCRVHILGDRIDLGTVLEQQHHDVDVAEARRNVQRRLLFAGARIHLRTVAQQNANNVGL